MKSVRRQRALLALEDGMVYQGWSFGAVKKTSGEVVFNTSMTGYPEILTDPSYRGQIVAMTYPEIGNYGIHPSQAESSRPWLSGFVVRSLCENPSSWLAKNGLSEYLHRHGVPGIWGVDTRDLTLRIRSKGVLKGVITSAAMNPARAVALAKKSADISSKNLVAEVSCTKPYPWTSETESKLARTPRPLPRGRKKGLSIAVVDCGIKFNILRKFLELGVHPTVLPASFSAEEVLDKKYDGLFLSNGPGDPASVGDVTEQVRKLLGKVPIFGICLGHQILGRALGCRTFKLKFGHHGGNHPVKNYSSGKVEITVQNHNYTVHGDDLVAAGAQVTHINLNDKTVEGMRLLHMPAFSVQYHPEAAPGPRDSRYLFGDFVELIKKFKKGSLKRGA